MYTQADQELKENAPYREMLNSILSQEICASLLDTITKTLQSQEKPRQSKVKLKRDRLEWPNGLWQMAISPNWRLLSLPLDTPCRWGIKA